MLNKPLIINTYIICETWWVHVWALSCDILNIHGMIRPFWIWAFYARQYGCQKGFYSWSISLFLFICKVQSYVQSSIIYLTPLYRHPLFTAMVFHLQKFNYISYLISLIIPIFFSPKDGG